MGEREPTGPTGEELEVLLEKFSDEEREGVDELVETARKHNIDISEVLDDYESAMALSKHNDLFEKYPRYLSDPNTMRFVVELCEDPEAKSYLEMDQEGLIDKINEVKSLRRITEKKDPRVQDIEARLRKELEMYEPQFADRAICGVLWGSIFFGDPSDDPDIDFDFIVVEENDVHQDLPQLSAEMDAFVERPMHTSVIVLHTMAKKIELIRKDRFPESFKGIESVLDYSILLTGELIPLLGARHEVISKEVEETRELIIEACDSNKLFRAMMLKKMNDVISLREKRASDR